MALGNLNGITMAIPAKYRFFPVVYEGDDIWNAQWLEKNRDRIATPAMKISSFGVLLHMPDYAPRSGENLDSWFHEKNRYGFNQDWILIGIRSNNHEAKIGEKGWLRHYIHRVKESNSSYPAAAWHYEITDQNIYGLRHEELVGSTPNEASFIAQSGHKDLYTDTSEWTTKIECHRMIAPPYVPTQCTQIFVMPDLDSFIEMTYNPQHLKDWREMQKQVTSIVKTFACTDFY
ncbi:hypothetical protein [Paraburkholderia fynbosensis]|uniref:Uncharacterized protein n=1 Tax=Paraburkholderia fynbosensis TaxID=1200993 RepID=A0A6J5GLU3_9BURK|nr:hypothetical protein [Paraburkholderia fynbosensis]CAB3799658.1 hypothetical protein LMG27177_04686 [Paraburkholderia fynbosensis]